jgi:hypothetical protein
VFSIVLSLTGTPASVILCELLCGRAAGPAHAADHCKGSQQEGDRINGPGQGCEHPESRSIPMIAPDGYAKAAPTQAATVLLPMDLGTRRATLSVLSTTGPPGLDVSLPAQSLVLRI